MDVGRGKKFRKVEGNRRRKEQRIQYASAQRKELHSGQIFAICRKAKAEAGRGISGDLGLHVEF